MKHWYYCTSIVPDLNILDIYVKFLGYHSISYFMVILSILGILAHLSRTWSTCLNLGQALPLLVNLGRFWLILLDFG